MTLPQRPYRCRGKRRHNDVGSGLCVWFCPGILLEIGCVCNRFWRGGRTLVGINSNYVYNSTYYLSVSAIPIMSQLLIRAVLVPSAVRSHSTIDRLGERYGSKRLNTVMGLGAETDDCVFCRLN